MSTTNTISNNPIEVHSDDNLPPKMPYMNVSPQSTSLHRTSPAPSQHLRPENQRHDTKNSTMDDEFLTRPIDTEKHSKLPYFLRMQGSITPRMIVPLAFVGCWATLITCISKFWHPLIVDSLLLTVLGFVVGLGISFRTSSSYERYIEGRKYWAQLIQVSRDLARHIWIHVDERHDINAEEGRADLLAKITALNLIVAYAVALKHKLRFEPYTNHDDLKPLVSHLSTFASSAFDPDAIVRRKSHMKRIGEYLGLTFAESNPRKQIKRSKKNLGNLPLEILAYLSAFLNSVTANGTLANGAHQGMVLANLASLNEVLAGTERVLNTPLPLAYSIAISQITWVYVMALPFQLWEALGWITIPGTILGAYIILGIAAIGREIENPFGYDANDLPLDNFCKQLELEISVITSKPRPKPEDFINTEENLVLYSMSSLSYGAWKAKSTAEIRATLEAKAHTTATAVDFREKPVLMAV